MIPYGSVYQTSLLSANLLFQKGPFFTIDKGGSQKVVDVLLQMVKDTLERLSPDSGLVERLR